ncbi:MAG: O-antigen ligase family protein [Actinomycetota bacterium]
MSILTAGPVVAGQDAAEHPARQVALSPAVEAIAALAVLWSLWRAITNTGGREGNGLIVGLAVTLAAFLAIRGWRFLGIRNLAAAALLTTGPLVVCLLSPMGAAGLRDAASYAYAAVTYVFVRAILRIRKREQFFALAVCLLTLDQFSKALLPWWGGGDPTHRMTGTFYWHNQFGAYMMALALFTASLAVFGKSLTRRFGLLVAPIAAASVFFSASRGSLLLLAVFWVFIGLLAAVQRTRAVRGIVTWLLIGIATGVLTTLLGSGLFFQTPSTAIGAVQARNAEQTAEGNLSFRMEHSRAAIAVFREHPVAGTGLGGYMSSASRHLPFGLRRSPWVHNGYLQALAEGGLLLMVPLVVLLGGGLVGVAALARRRFRTLAVSAPRAAAGIAAVALLAHSAVDIDWSYPVFGALAAAMLACALGPEKIRERLHADDRAVARFKAPAKILVIITLILALGASALGLQRWQHVTALLNAHGATDPAAWAQGLLRASRGLPDERLAVRLLAAAVPPDFDGTILLPAGAVAVAVADTRRVGAINGMVQMQRAQALVGLGRPAEGRAIAAGVIAREGVARPFLLGEYAEVLSAVGDNRSAQELLVVALRDPRPFALDAAQYKSLLDVLTRVSASTPVPVAMCTIARANEALPQFVHPPLIQLPGC